MEEELVKVVDASKEIIRKSVLGIFGEEALDKVDEALKSITFDIDKDPKIAEECSAYCRENEVYWTESSFNASIGRIQAISTTIHELSHAFSHLISKEKVNCIVEESIANLFAEMCINYYLQNETEFPYITKEELARLTKSGYKEENSYVKEGEFLRSVLFPLREQGKDIEAIKEYLFGKKSRFLTICEDVLGQKFSNVLDEMKDVRIYVGINETEKYLPKANSEMLNIIETFSEDLTKQEAEDNSINNEQGQLYVTYSPLLEYVSYLRSIRRFVEERKETFKIEDIDELYEQEYCTSRLLGIDYGVPNYIRNIINWWYEKSNGDMEKFGAISKIVLIPFEQIKPFLDKKRETGEIDFDELYKFISECFWDSDKKAYDYLIENFLDKEYIDHRNDRNRISEIYNICYEYGAGIEHINHRTVNFLRKTEFEPEELKYVFGYLYNTNRQVALREFLTMMQEKGILYGEYEQEAETLATDIARELSGTQDLRTLISMQRDKRDGNETIASKIYEKVDAESLAVAMKKAMIFGLYGQRFYEHKFEAVYDLKITNKDEILENIRRRNFKKIDLQFENIPKWAIDKEKDTVAVLEDSSDYDEEELAKAFKHYPLFLCGEHEDTKMMDDVSAMQFFEELDNTQEFNIGLKANCRCLLDLECNRAREMRRKAIDGVRRILKTDKTLSQEEIDRWNELADEAETRLIDESNKETKRECILSSQEVGNGVKGQIADTVAVDNKMRELATRIRDFRENTIETDEAEK